MHDMKYGEPGISVPGFCFGSCCCRAYLCVLFILTTGAGTMLTHHRELRVVKPASVAKYSPGLCCAAVELTACGDLQGCDGSIARHAGGGCVVLGAEPGCQSGLCALGWSGSGAPVLFVQLIGCKAIGQPSDYCLSIWFEGCVWTLCAC